ncbi:MAG: hypothetical protein VXW32_13140 [Myxococcota bacterium]|nr:hypothetical protein [Myxococcota bacterium]
MSQHIPPALLQKFVEGTLEEPVAVAVALHIDECSRCHAAATAAEPLGQDFASVDDPKVPVGLLDTLHERARNPLPDVTSNRRRPNTALYILAAGLVLALLFYPEGIDPGSEAQMGDALGAAPESSPSQLILGVTIGLVAGAWLTFRRLTRRKQDSKRPR